MVEYSVLSLLYLLSYFKLFVTLVKYIPQVSQAEVGVAPMSSARRYSAT